MSIPSRWGMTAPYEEVMKRQRATWSAGNFTALAGVTVLVGELLCEAVGLRPGQRVLDVCTGSGNTALSAARRLCIVSGIDFVPHLLETARKRAALELLNIEFKDGAVENIPFPNKSFDAVLSTFGCMFAVDQRRTADELVRVCKRGGKIGLACWTPDGTFGEFSKLTAKYIPPHPNAKPPTLWGSKEGLEMLFGGNISNLHTTRKTVFLRAQNADAYVERMKKFSGPLISAYDALDENTGENLTRDATEWAARSSRSGDETIEIPSDYLEIVATL